MKEDDEITYVVSGLPRSGTSMMMRILEAAGIAPVTDGLRQADDDNPRGYYELEQVKQIKEDRSWLDRCRGKAVKLISQLLRDLPDDRPYKVVFMRRDLDEVLRSQQEMLARRGQSEPMDDDAMKRMFIAHLAETEDWLRVQAHMQVLYVSYNRIVTDPRPQLERLAPFLGRPCDREKMLSVVETLLYRHRAQTSTGLGSGRS